MPKRRKILSASRADALVNDNTYADPMLCESIRRSLIGMAALYRSRRREAAAYRQRRYVNGEAHSRERRMKLSKPVIKMLPIQKTRRRRFSEKSPSISEKRSRPWAVVRSSPAGGGTRERIESNFRGFSGARDTGAAMTTPMRESQKSWRSSCLSRRRRAAKSRAWLRQNRHKLAMSIYCCSMKSWRRSEKEVIIVHFLISHLAAQPKRPEAHGIIDCELISRHHVSLSPY